jgi:hypothetical protein
VQTIEIQNRMSKPEVRSNIEIQISKIQNNLTMPCLDGKLLSFEH